MDKNYGMYFPEALDKHCRTDRVASSHFAKYNLGELLQRKS